MSAGALFLFLWHQSAFDRGISFKVAELPQNVVLVRKKNPHQSTSEPAWAATQDVIRARQHCSERAGGEHAGDGVAYTARGYIKFTAGKQRS